MIDIINDQEVAADIFFEFLLQQIVQVFIECFRVAQVLNDALVLNLVYSVLLLLAQAVLV